MAKKKDTKTKPKQDAKDFTKKDFMNILETLVNPKQTVSK